MGWSAKYAERIAVMEAKLATVTLVDWARLAAFIDGEGYVGLARNGRKSGSTISNRISITSVDPRLPNWLKETFGGTVVIQPTNPSRHKIAYQWSVASRHAALILTQVRPLLLIKDRQADIVLAFRALLNFGRNTRLSEAEIAERDRMQQEITKVNKRGVPSGV